MRDQDVSNQVPIEVMKVADHIGDAFLLGRVEHNAHVSMQKVAVDNRDFLVGVLIADRHGQVCRQRRASNATLEAERRQHLGFAVSGWTRLMMLVMRVGYDTPGLL